MMDENRKLKIAMFSIIRNSIVMPEGFKRGKSLKEINRMAYDTMQTLLNEDLINWDMMGKAYEEGKNANK